MASVFPGAIDSFTDPLSTSPLNSPSHAGQHQDLNDAVEKVETYMGLVLVTKGTFSAASSASPLSIDPFVDLYDNYRVIIAIDSANNNATRIIKFRLRLATGNDTSANYAYSSQQTSLGSTTIDLGYSSYTATEMDVVAHYYAAQSSYLLCDIVNPKIATKPTMVQGNARGGTAAANTHGNVNSSFGINVSHVGFSVYPSAGTIAGNYFVYGYRK